MIGQGANIQYDENKMFAPSDVEKMMYSNAMEEYCYFDTVLISPKIGNSDLSKYDAANYFTSYAQMGTQRLIPFFKVRNSGDVGEALNNFEQKDRMSVPFHVFGLAVQFFTATEASSSVGTDAQVADMIFQTLIPQHTSFSFKVGQVEKMRANVGIMPAAGGLVNNMMDGGALQNNGAYYSTNYGCGWQNKWNVYQFKTPIGIARNQSIEGAIEFSEYAQDVLLGLQGPGFYSSNQPAAPAQVSGIQVRLLGVREVQFRNLQHF